MSVLSVQTEFTETRLSCQSPSSRDSRARLSFERISTGPIPPTRNLAYQILFPSTRFSATLLRTRGLPCSALTLVSLFCPYSLSPPSAQRSNPSPLPPPAL